METYLNDRLVVYRNYFDANYCQQTFDYLLKEIKWLQKSHNNEGKIVDLPRLTANYGEKSYDYSGLVFNPEPWTDFLVDLKAIAEKLASEQFNALVLQYYRDGNDRVNWHSDDDLCVGTNPVIVSISFGESRGFWVRHKTNHDERYKLTLHSGDIVIMQGDMQHVYVHKVPIEKDKTEARINLTFRKVVT